MSGFASDWLDLREPADRRARDAGLCAAAAAWLDARPWRVVVDLGAGTGATRRALAPRLRAPAAWRLVDDDAALLALALARADDPATTAHRLDMRALEALPLDDATLVTASALFDLVGADWLAALVARTTAAGSALYAALSYDGRMRWSVPHPDDAAVREAFDAHQRGDKGLGPALGPTASDVLARLCADAGHRVARARSDWVLGPGEAALQRELVAGIAQAAAETGMLAPARIDAWCSVRQAQAERVVCTVGHEDLLALPPG
ncbi:hypothetical protein [Coralloluteibacterium thermophilus]|uniref:Class I SAM-dependent methyltransferase n=1 Tax=Coralloluteibacterium thermophilum TaxID=2707049 RepID=A0ABV9NKM2_9GAMM